MDFEIDKEIHKNPSNRIRSIALARYFIEDIPIEETIKNPQEEYKIGNDVFKGYGIYDYLLFVKVKSNMFFTLELPIENSFMLSTILLHKHNRYYISLDGGRLLKNYTNKNEVEKINSGYKVTLANKVDNIDIPQNINYQFYIDECNKILDQFKPLIKKRILTTKKKINTTNDLKLF